MPHKIKPAYQEDNNYIKYFTVVRITTKQILIIFLIKLDCCCIITCTNDYSHKFKPGKVLDMEFKLQKPFTTNNSYN